MRQALGSFLNLAASLRTWRHRLEPIDSTIVSWHAATAIKIESDVPFGSGRYFPKLWEAAESGRADDSGDKKGGDATDDATP